MTGDTTVAHAGGLRVLIDSSRCIVIEAPGGHRMTVPDAAGLALALDQARADRDVLDEIDRAARR